MKDTTKVLVIKLCLVVVISLGVAWFALYTITKPQPYVPPSDDKLCQSQGYDRAYYESNNGVVWSSDRIQANRTIFIRCSLTILVNNDIQTIIGYIPANTTISKTGN